MYEVKWVDPEERIFKIRYALGKRRSMYYKIFEDDTISGCEKCVMENTKYRPESRRYLGKGRGPTFCEVCNGFGRCPEVQEFIGENNLVSYNMTYPILDGKTGKNRSSK